MHFYFVTFYLINRDAKVGDVPAIQTGVVQLDHALEYHSDIKAAEAQLEFKGMKALLLSWQELKGRDRPDHN
ncbi:hypothetical protein ACDH53_25805 [Pseudomonas tremae]|uniref:Uncharacterized protein n=1 Tax=Pseudomonas tremae TaxID=200454 RepID=A0ABV4PMS7_9PSED|nr:MULTISPECIES: hypothetical protein [Pseudomonas syringae group genomosp. 2]